VITTISQNCSWLAFTDDKVSGLRSIHRQEVRVDVIDNATLSIGGTFSSGDGLSCARPSTSTGSALVQLLRMIRLIPGWLLHVINDKKIHWALGCF
jgi:hypothetical protein